MEFTDIKELKKLLAGSRQNDDYDDFGYYEGNGMTGSIDKNMIASYS